MDEDDGIQRLSVALDRTLVFLDRPEVGEQLLVLAAVLVASWILAWVAWRLLDVLRRRRVRRRLGDPAAPVPPDSIPIRLTRSITAPVIGIALATVTQRQLEAAGHVTGLLSELISVFVVLFVAELIMAMVVVPLDPREAVRYRRRFFKPLMWIVVGLMVLDHITDLRALARAGR